MSIRNIEEAREELNKAIDDAEDEIRNRYRDGWEQYKKTSKKYEVDSLIETLSNVDKTLPLCVISDDNFWHPLVLNNPKLPGIFFEIIDDQGTYTKDYKGQFINQGRKEIILYANNKRRNGKLKDYYFLQTVQDLFDIILNPLKGQGFRVGILCSLYNRGHNFLGDDKYFFPTFIKVLPYYQLDCGAIVPKKEYDRYKNYQCLECEFHNTCNCSRYSYYHNEWRRGYGRNPHQYYYGSVKPIEVLAVSKSYYQYDDIEDIQLNIK